MGIFGDIFDGHAGVEEEQALIREVLTESTRRTGAHQRQRSRQNTNIVAELQKETSDHHKTRMKLKQAEEKLDESKNLAKNLIIERDAMYKTVRYLAEKWEKPISKDEIKDIQQQEKHKLDNKEKYKTQVDEYVDDKIDYEVALKKQNNRAAKLK